MPEQASTAEACFVRLVRIWNIDWAYIPEVPLSAIESKNVPSEVAEALDTSCPHLRSQHIRFQEVSGLFE